MQCTAKSKRSGQQCGNHALKGATVCRMHGGKAPQVQAAAKVRAARIAAHEEAQRMVARAGVDADPIEHLLESLHRAAALVEAWGVMVAAIDEMAERESDDRGHLRGELGYEEVPHDHGTDVVVLPKDRMMAVNAKGEARVHPYMVEYQNALERRAKFAKLCIDAGIAERQVRIAEEQGQLIAQMIGGILDDLKIERTPEVTRTVGRHLRLVASN